MPRKAKKPCSWPGCPETVLIGTGYCEIHKRKKDKEYEARRGTSAERGYGNTRWRKYRKWFLSQRENALCVDCMKEGRAVPATDVDHIVPVDGPDDPLFWEQTNHQGLCHSHHSSKTAKERGFGKASLG